MNGKKFRDNFLRMTWAWSQKPSIYYKWAQSFCEWLDHQKLCIYLPKRWFSPSKGPNNSRFAKNPTSHQAIRPDLIKCLRFWVCCKRKFIDERKKKKRCGHHKFQTFLPAVIGNGRPVKVYRKKSWIILWMVGLATSIHL